MHETMETQKLKTKFVNRDVAIGGNKQILEFIAGVRFQCSPACSTDTSVETIRYLFEAGYCYYFARMLEDAFPGGDVCLMYPFGHITYVYDGIIYDIGGVSDAEYESLIPIKYLDNTISVFKHNGSSDVSREDGRRIADECIKQGKIIAGKGYFELTQRPQINHKIKQQFRRIKL